MLWLDSEESGDILIVGQSSGQSDQSAVVVGLFNLAESSEIKNINIIIKIEKVIDKILIQPDNDCLQHWSSIVVKQMNLVQNQQPYKLVVGPFSS